jgi:hypothetical protein
LAFGFQGITSYYTSPPAPSPARRSAGEGEIIREGLAPLSGTPFNEASKRGETPLSYIPPLEHDKNRALSINLFERGIKGGEYKK